MSTQCFLRKTGEHTAADWVSLATNAPNLAGTGVGWATPLPIRTTRGGGVTATTTSTVAGTTLGVEVSGPSHWITPPIDADVTISGTITFNLWMGESATAANVGAQCVVERVDSTGAIVSTIANSEKGVEVPKVSSIAAQNWTVAATSTNMLKGDRIRIRVAGNDAGGTMASGNSFTFDYAGTSAAADGDSYVQFTETFGFLTTNPTTTTIYPTTTVSDIDPGGAGTDTYEAWTTRGTVSGGTQGKVAGVTGWTVPLQTKTAAGGNLEEWFTKPLAAFTLSAPVLANVAAYETGAAFNGAVRAELAVCASDGTGATVWAGTSFPTELALAYRADVFYLAGDDVAVTDGQRLRIRFYFDDCTNVAMGTTSDGQITYAGDTPGTYGDTYLIFDQSLTEYVASAVELPILVMAPR